MENIHKQLNNTAKISRKKEAFRKSLGANNKQVKARININMIQLTIDTMLQRSIEPN